MLSCPRTRVDLQDCPELVLLFPEHVADFKVLDHIKAGVVLVIGVLLCGFSLPVEIIYDDKILKAGVNLFKLCGPAFYL